MNAKYTFLQLAQDVLIDSKKPLMARDIWEIAVQKGLDKKLGSLAKMPLNSVFATICKNLKKGNPIFYVASKQPTTFYLSAYKKDFEQCNKNRESTQEIPKIKAFCERDLHPLLVKSLNENPQFNCYCKTIYHEKSIKGKQGSDKWNYPDIVGVHFPFDDDYSELALELLDMLHQSHCKLYSFELKISLDWSNLKQFYFQAVSNSSWANEGYLVVFETIDDEIIGELRRLNESFGIGVIGLEESGIEVILQAKHREIDISTLNMLVEKNKDFREFIASVLEDNDVNDKHRIRKDRYDKIFDDNELEKYLNHKKISKS